MKGEGAVMVNKNLFASTGKTAWDASNVKKNKTPSVAPATDTTNYAGGSAYKHSAKHTLAQIACTGTFNGTFYADSEENLRLAEQAVAELHDQPEFIAKVAVYAREFGFMKDMPSYIVAKLADVDKVLFRKAFRKVVDNGKMLRNVVQIARSGRLSKKYNLSAGTYRHALRDWFNDRSPYALFKAAVGNDPELGDIIKMCRPKPNTPSKAALYRYLIGKDVELEALPEPVRSYELYKRGLVTDKLPEVDFRFLTNLTLTTENWKEIARNAGWTMTRMNLETFRRHGVLEDKKMVQLIADRLRNPDEIKKARAFPYQLFMAYQQTCSNMPHEINEALQDAADTAIGNVPVFGGTLKVAIDVSGSMTWGSITGNRGSATSKMRPVDVAALFGAAMLRGNKSAEIMPFSNRLYPDFKLNPRDSVMTNAQKLCSIPSGGTDCSLVLAEINRRKEHVDAVVYVSDNESWIDRGYGSRTTGMMSEWVDLKKRCPNARLVLIDLTVGNNSQVTQHSDILQVGGFSDMVFNVTDRFLKHGHDTDHWISEIEKTSLD